ncbi:4971_t:CDS:2 [Ambispora leptoticha]|uniref:4971_t:CDS:1 n=1 Tax=Ambispora leptoticha TaxID=144679 RepID=A0A9N9CVF5_9GLOM|nr:4971_t:CDS:2 [Ambispora leptoticha]
MENTSTNLEVTVLINDNDTSVRTELPKAAKLTEIREILAKNPEIRMGHKAHFIICEEGSAIIPIIPHDEEENYLLNKIIDSASNLKIKGELKPNWAEIIEKNSLEYGLFFTKDGPKPAEKKAFKFKSYSEITFRTPKTSDQELKYSAEIDDMRAKNPMFSTNISVKLPNMPISANFGGTYRSNSTHHSNNVT